MSGCRKGRKVLLPWQSGWACNWCRLRREVGVRRGGQSRREQYIVLAERLANALCD